MPNDVQDLIDLQKTIPQRLYAARHWLHQGAAPAKYRELALDLEKIRNDVGQAVSYERRRAVFRNDEPSGVGRDELAATFDRLISEQMTRMADTAAFIKHDTYLEVEARLRSAKESLLAICVFLDNFLEHPAFAEANAHQERDCPPSLGER